MNLAGQDKPRVLDTTRGALDDRGYLMVVLLIGMAVTAIWMSSLLPSWRQQAVREKEAELIFRGEQYARAIALFYRKNQRLPPNIDTLVSQRYLRKKYKDPMTGDDFLPVGGIVGQSQTQGAAPQQAQGRGRQAGPQVPQVGGQVAITGVRSASNDTSIVVYRNQQSYSQFPFDYTAALLKMGVGNNGVGGGGRPQGRGRGDETAPIPAGGRGPQRGGPGANVPRGGASGPGPAGRGGAVGPGPQPSVGRGR